MKGNGMSSDTEAIEGEGPQLRQRPVRDARRGIAETALWLAVTAERVGAEAAQQALPIAGSDDKPVRLAAQFASSIHGLVLAGCAVSAALSAYRDVLWPRASGQLALS